MFVCVSASASVIVLCVYCECVEGLPLHFHVICDLRRGGFIDFFDKLKSKGIDLIISPFISM